MAHFQKILVPVDSSPCSIAALAEATVLASELGSAVTVLHVHADDHTPQEENDLEGAIASAKAQLTDRLDRRTETGDPVRRILEAASGYDLIVMGTHGRVGRLYSLIGSIAETIVRSASCPVLTIRDSGGVDESFAERIHGRPSLAEQHR